MPSAQSLSELSDIQIKDVEKDGLTEIGNIVVDPAIPIAQRFSQYLSAVKNPYLFRCGDTAIKLCYSNTGTTVDGAISVYLSHLKNL